MHQHEDAILREFIKKEGLLVLHVLKSAGQPHLHRKIKSLKMFKI
jgi:hypothetical protein